MNLHSNRIQLENTDNFIICHDESTCHGAYCTLHNRSDHGMRAFPQVWRYDLKIIERKCPHGIGHPDPDEYMLITNPYLSVHGCDGCCAEDDEHNLPKRFRDIAQGE